MKPDTNSTPGRAPAPDFFSPQVLEARRFYLDLDPPKDRPLVVICGGVERAAADYAIHRRTFPFHSIEYVAMGRGTLSLRGRSHVLETGMVFSYGPGIRHDIIADPAQGLLKYFVDFDGAAARELLRSCRLGAGGVGRVFPPNEIQGLFEELIRSGSRSTRNATHLCTGLLECIALRIVDFAAPLAGPENLSFATYHHCRQHIQGNFERLRTLQQIAAECHIDPAYLCRLFRRYDHQSPYRFLLRLKMNRAAEALQQPGALVKQVAEGAGFGDPFHFSRAFKAVFGVSPDRFRRLR